MPLPLSKIVLNCTFIDILDLNLTIRAENNKQITKLSPLDIENSLFQTRSSISLINVR